jgi:hypothetical protein
MNAVFRRQLFLAAPAAALVATLAASCARLDTRSEVDVKPIEVKPIHITVDVNVRIDRELDEFFAFEEEVPATKPATAPTTTTTTATEPGNPS